MEGRNEEGACCHLILGMYQNNQTAWSVERDLCKGTVFRDYACDICSNREFLRIIMHGKYTARVQYRKTSSAIQSCKNEISVVQKMGPEKPIFAFESQAFTLCTKIELSTKVNKVLE